MSVWPAERCDPPQCVFPLGHRGECRRTHISRPCGRWMPLAKEPCARQVGHTRECRTRYSMDCGRDADWTARRSGAA